MLQVFGIDDSIAIPVFSLIFVLVSHYLAKAFAKRDELKAIQKEINAWNAEIREAKKANDEARMKKLLERNEEMMKKISSMTFLSLRSMVVSLPLILVVYGVVIPTLFPGFSTTLPFDIHLNSLLSLHVLQNAVYGGKGFFIVCAIPIGLVVESLLTKLEEKKA